MYEESTIFKHNFKRKNQVRIEIKLEYLFIQMKEYQIWAGELPQLVVKPDDLCLTPRIHIVVGKN